MSKYTRVAKNTWNEVFTYRLSFVLWRFRVVLQLLVVYFLWRSLIPPGQEVFGYTQEQMLTYILGTAIIGTFVFATRTWDIGSEINEGNLSNYLIRPISYFKYYMAKDLGDKLMNLSCAIIELTLLYFLLNPPIFIQTNLPILLLTLAATILATFMFFMINFLLGMIGFWSPEVWAPRFIFFIIIQFFGGTIFPLDILPRTLYNIFILTPFPYLMFFPVKIYLGQMTTLQMLQGIGITALWAVVLFLIVSTIWKKGLKSYTAQGK